MRNNMNLERKKMTVLFCAIILLSLTACTPAKANTIDKRSQILEFLERNPHNLPQSMQGMTVNPNIISGGRILSLEESDRQIRQMIEREAEQMILFLQSSRGQSMLERIETTHTFTEADLQTLRSLTRFEQERPRIEAEARQREAERERQRIAEERRLQEIERQRLEAQREADRRNIVRGIAILVIVILAVIIIKGFKTSKANRKNGTDEEVIL